MFIVHVAADYRTKQSDVVTLADPILQKYACTIAIKDRDIWLLSTNATVDPSGPIYSKAREYGVTHFQGSENAVNPFTNQTLASIVKTHRQITLLDLRGSDVTHIGLANLKELKSLEALALDANQLGPSGVDVLLGLENLRELTLESIGPSKVEAFRQKLPRCEIYVAEEQNL